MEESRISRMDFISVSDRGSNIFHARYEVLMVFAYSCICELYKQSVFRKGVRMSNDKRVPEETL